MSNDIDRREFCVMLTAGVVATAGCSETADPVATALPRLLGLSSSEAGWVGALTEREQKDLRDALLAGGQSAPRTIDLLMKVLGRREHLFPYVGYPPLSNTLTACDGLLRE